MQTGLVRYDNARRALQEAHTIDEVKDVRDKAEAMRLYAQQAKDTEMAVWAAEIKLRAERKAGELIKAKQEDGELAKPDSGNRNLGLQRVSLKDIGVSHSESSRWQQEAAVPEEKFEEYIAESKAKGDVPTAAGLRRLNRSNQNKAKVSAISDSENDTCTVLDLAGLAASGQKFGTIYADPPWVYDNQGTRAATGNHYNGLTVDELCALPVSDLAAPDSHLHLWTTNGFLFECPRIFDAWGFEFRSSLVWVKPQMGIGNYWRNSHEFLLTAIRGNAKRFYDKSLMSWLKCDRGAHSAKPEKIRHMIESASLGPRLELFGRAPAEGWTVWGNQIERGLFNRSVREVA